MSTQLQLMALSNSFSGSFWEAAVGCGRALGGGGGGDKKKLTGNII